MHNATLYVTAVKECTCPECDSALEIDMDSPMPDNFPNSHLAVCDSCGRSVILLPDDLIASNGISAALPLEVTF